jgi:serine/threonine protein kinase
MTPQRWQLLQHLFDRGVPLDQDARLHMVLAECGDDALLRDQVLSMLRAHDGGTEFERQVEAAIGGTLETPDFAAGQMIGRFRIARLLGRGGMGAVYLAERADDQYQQQVALKVVTRNVLHGDLSRRFRAERQILARLNHPNIARLLDGGHMPDGTPYIVMEYIEGLRIDHYCEQNHLSTQARLRLIQQVCAAIHYAHQHLIVHRDLKPANILVTKDGVPKLLDFGIAKLLDPQQAPDFAPITRFRDRVLTPEHASPEQLRGERVGTVSDVYSLGVLMYELLTGRHPYRLANRSLYEIERAICEQNHESPSAGVQSGARETGSSHLRALARELAGDLDNIVFKAMQHQPERRYASAAALAQDIQNYIERRPVQARPDTLIYRSRQFIRRNIVAVTSVACLALLTTALVGFYTMELAAERYSAELERQTATRVSDFMIDAFQLANSNESLDKAVVQREVLDAAVKRIDTDLTAEPRVRLASMRHIGETYAGLGLIEQAYELLEETVAQSRSTPQISRLDLARALEALGNALHVLNRIDDAARAFDEAWTIRTQLRLGGDVEAIKLLNSIAANQRALQKFAEALQSHRRAEQYARALSPPSSKLLGQVYMGYAMTYLAAGNHGKAELYARESLPLLKGAVYAGQDLYANSLETLGDALRKQLRLPEAEAVFRELLDVQIKHLGPDHGLMGRVYYNLGGLHHAAGQLAQALRELDTSLEFERQQEGPRSPVLVTTLLEKSGTLRDLGRLEAAQVAFNQAQSIASEKLQPNDSRQAFVIQERGALRLARGDFAGAERDLRDAKARLLRQGDPERETHAAASLGEALLRDGRLVEARSVLGETMALRSRIFPAGHWAIGDARSSSLLR